MGARLLLPRPVLLALLLTLAHAALARPLAGQEPPPSASDLSALASEARWDDLIEAADARLAVDPADNLALYWKARATVETARPLLGGRAFALDLGRTMLHRAEDLLAQVHETPGDPTADAREWLVWARYLAGAAGDPALVPDLEHWFATEGRGYAAYLRGLIARDRGDTDVVDWLAKAVAAAPDRAEFALALAEALSGAGRRDEALAAWDRARDAHAPLSTLAASLLLLLPGADNAARRLERLDVLVAGEAATDGLLQWNRAFALEQLGRVADAEAGLAGATTNRTPDVERAHARLLRLLQRPVEAAEHLLPAARDGDDASLQDLTSIADALAQEWRWDESLTLYDQVLAIEPNDERAAFNRALAQSQSGRSLDGYHALVERWPGRADVLNNAALAELGWGHRDEARALLEAAVKLEGAIDARENLAQLLLDSDAPDGARAAGLLAQVLSEDPVRDRALLLRLLAVRSTPAVGDSPR